jgi:hypothetical protein
MIFWRRWRSDLVVIAVAVLLAGPALGQQAGNTVAKLTSAEGNVLVSQGDAMVTGANDQRLAVGQRVTTTTGATVTISYDVGCDIRLKENERFTVTTGPCAVLAGQVESLGPAAGAIGGGTAGTALGLTGNATALVISGAIAGVGIYEMTRKNPISPH